MMLHKMKMSKVRNSHSLLLNWKDFSRQQDVKRLTDNESRVKQSLILDCRLWFHFEISQYFMAVLLDVSSGSTTDSLLSDEKKTNNWWRTCGKPNRSRPLQWWSHPILRWLNFSNKWKYVSISDTTHQQSSLPRIVSCGRREWISFSLFWIRF